MKKNQTKIPRKRGAAGSQDAVNQVEKGGVGHEYKKGKPGLSMRNEIRQGARPKVDTELYRGLARKAERNAGRRGGTESDERAEGDRTKGGGEGT